MANTPSRYLVSAALTDAAQKLPLVRKAEQAQSSPWVNCSGSASHDISVSQGLQTASQQIKLNASVSVQGPNMEVSH